MKKITDFIVNKRNLILVIFVFLTGICLYTSTKVHINSDITKYLPETSETKIGKEIMKTEFEDIKSSTLNVMFKNLSEEEKNTTYETLQKIEGVHHVNYENTKEYNHKEYTLYSLNVDDYADSKTAEKVYHEVNEMQPEAMSGNIYSEFKPVLEIWTVGVAIIMAMIILTILSESYIEPWLYLISIGIAVFINKGTNIIFPSVSNITDSITAILQLALSMDYSIMLSNRYRQEREKEKDKLQAMKNALYESFKAISSSSITTIVGLLALVFMSFTIGKDLGFVLAKGVLLSLVSIFFCLPGLLLMCDQLIMNSKKKSIHLDLTKMGKYSYKTKWIQFTFIILAFIIAYLLKGNLGILYTDSQQDEIGKQFPMTNQMAIVYENKYEEMISKYCKSMKDNKKANPVLCYGNTINEKLTYDELNKKFKDLGQNIEIEDDLIKLIYYNYYSKNNKDRMSLNEFMDFMKSDIYTNDEIAASMDQEMKNHMDLLENFASKDHVYQKRSINEIAHILGMSEHDVQDLFVYYDSKSSDTKMTIKELVHFILNDVYKNPDYRDYIDANTLALLKRLQLFMDNNTIHKSMTSKEIATMFGMDQTMVDGLFLLYKMEMNTPASLTLNEFSTLALSLKDDPQYQTMFSDETIKKLTLLQILSNENEVNKKYFVEELVSTLSSIGIQLPDDRMIHNLYFYYYYLNNVENGIYHTNTVLTFHTFVSDVMMDPNISSLLPGSLDSYKPILMKFSDKEFIITKLKCEDMVLSLIPFGFEETQIKMIYELLSNQIDVVTTGKEITLTPYEIIYIMKNQLSQQDPKLIYMTMLMNIMDLSYSQKIQVVPSYSYEELAGYLSQIDSSIQVNTISLGYGYYDYQNNVNMSDKTMNIKELINFLVKNIDDPLISSKLKDYKDLLFLGYHVIQHTNTKYTYQEMASFIGQDEFLVQCIYHMANTHNERITLSPLELTNFILDHKDNELLKDKLNKDMIYNLKLLKTVMESTINHIEYNANEVAQILDSDAETLRLMMSLYHIQYHPEEVKISLLDFTDFIIQDVALDPKYSSRIEKGAKDKLTIVNGLMKNTINEEKYNSFELYSILNSLNDGLDYNLIDMVYIYHGSKNHYDSSWKLTIEEIIHYVHDDLLKDEKYAHFLDENTIQKITDAKKTVEDVKKLLVTDQYSRVIMNTTFAHENKETFDFIQNTLDQMSKYDGIYLIGDSPMALEMSKSFNGELNYITVLTMIFIFVVVAFTFKSLWIPLILVLIIQCAVFITMAILSLTGTRVYFIALLIVQAILMGATVDYAIVYTTYYKESREKMDVQNAIINAYNKSIHTILSSSSILIIVTLMISTFAEAIPAKICETISQGTFASVILILLVLPGVLATFDKFICRKKEYKISKKNTN